MRVNTVVHAATRTPKSIAAATRNMVASNAVASAAKPVTQVPIGNVKLHHVSANGMERRMLCTVTAVASANITTPTPVAATP